MLIWNTATLFFIKRVCIFPYGWIIAHFLEKMYNFVKCKYVWWIVVFYLVEHLWLSYAFTHFFSCCNKIIFGKPRILNIVSVWQILATVLAPLFMFCDLVYGGWNIQFPETNGTSCKLLNLKENSRKPNFSIWT